MGYFTMRLQDAINETHKRIPDTLEQFSELGHVLNLTYSE